MDEKAAFPLFSGKTLFFTLLLADLYLFLAPWFITRKMSTPAIFSAFSATVFLFFLSVFYWDVFPACLNKKTLRSRQVK